MDIHQKEVRIETLIADFDYPDVDLEDVDKNWNFHWHHRHTILRQD